MANKLTRHNVLAEEKQQPYLLNTLQTVVSERQSGITIYPPQRDVFNVLHFTESGDVKVVTLGQSPYHGPGQAHGLALSVRPGIAIPPSLLNMHKELENTIPGSTRPNHGYLESWARQGALLLNTVLTVHTSQVHSRANLDWEIFTDEVISLTNQHREGVVFSLWGSHTQKRGVVMDKQRHHALKTPHPSPLSAHHGLLGCNHFVLANQWLGQRDETPID